MNSQGFDPLKSLSSLRDQVNRLINDGLSIAQGTPQLPVDVIETENAILVKAGPVVGIRAEALDVSLVGDALTIKGEIAPDTDGADSVTYHQQERKFGTFSRTVTIPKPVKADQAAASYKDGILTITLPKQEDVQPKVINVKPVDS